MSQDKIKVAEQFKQLCDFAFSQLLNINAGMQLFVTYIKTFKNAQWYIENIGPFFYKHGEKVKTRNVEFFRTYTFEKQYSDWLKIGEVIGSGVSKKIADGILASIRNMVDFKDADKDIASDLSVKLLILYSRYVLIIREEIKSGKLLIENHDNENFMKQLNYEKK